MRIGQRAKPVVFDHQKNIKVSVHPEYKHFLYLFQKIHRKQFEYVLSELLHTREIVMKTLAGFMDYSAQQLLLSVWEAIEEAEVSEKNNLNPLK